MSSSRLPGKVMWRAAGRPLLVHMLRRVSGARTLDAVIVATSTLPADDPIAELCAAEGVPCFRGDECDVLDRYYRAAAAFHVDDVVRITADCPLIDPAVIDLIVREYLARRSDVDLVTNRHPLTFPDGMDVDVMSFDALEQAWNRASTPSQREHVIPYFWETGKRVWNVAHPDNLFPRYRWTVDYEEDALLVQRIFEALDVQDRIFGLQEIKAYVDANPELAALNGAYLPTENTK